MIPQSRDKAHAQFLQLQRIADFRESQALDELDVPFLADHYAYQAFVMRQAATNLDSRYHFSIQGEKLA